ncbi:hypothetical protein [Prevotella disiens]|uniref:hypothetical protein n=1 Tax=Prevotella disiens TaxID=28130 RepID=UPI00055F135E|nr:hypothetical protein [Prevotella disiens]
MKRKTAAFEAKNSRFCGEKQSERKKKILKHRHGKTLHTLGTANNRPTFCKFHRFFVCLQSKFKTT